MVKAKTKQVKNPIYRNRNLTKALLVIFVAIIVLSTFVQVNNFIRNNNSRLAVIKARNINEPQYEAIRSAKIDALYEGFVISDKTPTYSSKIDACYVTHSDSGWVTTSYYQDCYIRYVDLYSTTLNRNEIEQRLGSIHQVRGLFGEPGLSNSKICGSLYEDNYKITLSFLTWQVSAKVADELNCKVPKQTQSTFTLKGPIILDENLKTRFARFFDENKIDQSKQYVMMQSDNYYYNESLGCAVGFLCPSPRAEPITGF